MLDPKLDECVRELITQWNIAEQRIKKAEQVRASEVVASAIFELRYAGRKIVDALDLALKNPDCLPGSSEYEKIHAYLVDASEDCVKAKHDAIDAVMSFVTAWFYRAEQKTSLKQLQAFFPDYLEQTSKIHDVQDRIAKSRKDRAVLRDAIYNQIDRDDYDHILSLYDRMRKSSQRVETEIKREVFKERVLWAMTIIGTIFGAFGVYATFK